MRRILIIVLAVIVVGGGALYWFVFRPTPEPIPVSYSPGEFFVTNVADSNRLLKTTIIMMLVDDSYVATMDQHNAQIRDTIIFILRELTEDEIRSSGVENGIRGRIRTALNEKLQTDGIKEILFSDFVMQ